MPREARGQVNVFVLSGFDPLDARKIGATRAALEHLGFTRITTGQFYHGSEFVADMVRTAKDSPDARFVVVGVGAGVEAALSVVDAAAQQGVMVDLLASVDSPFWSTVPSLHPANVHHVMSLRAGNAWPAPAASAEEDVTFDVSTSLGVSGYTGSIEKLATELIAIACTVPPTTAVPALADEAPIPRPTAARSTQPHDGWAFMHPVRRLEDLEPKPQRMSAKVAPPMTKTE